MHILWKEISKLNKLAHTWNLTWRKTSFNVNIAIKKKPYSKVHLKNEKLNLKQTINEVLLEFSNRGQFVTHETLKVAINRITNKSLREMICWDVLSFNWE